MAELTAETLALLSRGEADAARTKIFSACRTGDTQALAIRAIWQVEGRLMPRDLTGARADLVTAAQGGNIGAARMLGGLVAAGVGGPRDWKAALDLLDAWKDRDPHAARQARLIAQMAIDENGDALEAPAMRHLSTSPSIQTFDAFMTDEECDWLVELGETRMRPAVIFHEGKRQFVADPVRDSDATAFPILSEWPFVHAINRRIAKASATAPEQGEPLQLLRYRPGQQYRAHLDALHGLGNQRMLTFLVYLQDCPGGGETYFTRLGITVAARKGTALLFSNSMPDGRPDPMSEHAGLPVRVGAKRVASRWIRQRPAADAEGFGHHEVAGPSA